MTDRSVALVTGANGYVGPALSRRLAAGGFDLALHAPARPTAGLGREMDGATLAAELEGLGAAAALLPEADLLTPEGNRAVVAATLDRFGRLDAACLVTGSIVVGPFLDMTAEQWERSKAANLDMVFWGLQAVLVPMVEAGRGQVVVFTSATGARPEPGVSVYSGTRAGANALVRAVGLEVARHGVVVNAIGTNFMDFPGFHRASGTDDPARRAKLESRVPVRRMGTMEELAEFTVVLLDGRSRFQTGQFFSYSGGWSA
jgi:NAD(P)-dependent dehydrogenase (short-subunit alcohol dehydrogenase family)